MHLVNKDLDKDGVRVVSGATKGFMGSHDAILRQIMQIWC